MHDGPCIEIDRTQRKYEFNYFSTNKSENAVKQAENSHLNSLYLERCLKSMFQGVISGKSWVFGSNSSTEIRWDSIECSS